MTLTHAILVGCVLVAGCGSVTATPLTASDAGGAAGGGQAGNDAGGAAGTMMHDAAADVAGDVEHVQDAALEHAQDAVLEQLPPPDPANNFVTNGDFSQGMAGWHVTGNVGAIVRGQFCATLIPNSPAYFGWGPQDGSAPLVLKAGERLRFIFSASTSAPLSVFTAQVGHTPAPPPIDFTADDNVGTALTPISHVFTVPADGDSAAGVVFAAEAATPATVCIDNVYLGP
jgi:hypothetical protein